MASKKNFLTITEAAELLNVSKASLRRWSNNGALRCYRVGKRNERRFDVDDLRKFISGSSQNSMDLSNKLNDKELTDNDQTFEGQDSANLNQTRTHICTFYKSPKEQWQQFRNHLLAHIEPKAQIVYLYHGDKERVINWIKDEGLDCEDLIARGDISLMSTQETYCSGGYFDTEEMLAFWRKIVNNAQKSGIEKLLLTGEMAWANSNVRGHEQLIPYEAALEHMLEIYPWVTVVCQYPVYQISGITVYDNLCIHTHFQLSDRLERCFSSG